MTPEELAVVRAAMAWRDAVLAHPDALRPLHNANNALTPALSELSRVTYALAVARGEREETRPYCSRCTGLHDPAEHAEPELIWVERTWADVRAGDRVRMPGSDATAHVQSAVHLRWHVKPGTGTSQYNPPQPLEWSGVRVTLETGTDGDAHQYEMDPAKPVEIELAESEVYVLNGLGWENRVGLVIES